MSLLATLDQAKAIMGTTTQQAGTTATINNNLVLQNLRVVTNRVNQKKRPATPPFWPFFEPTIGTRTYPMLQTNINAGLNLFTFPDNLLELTGVNVNGNTVTVPTTISTFPTSNQPPFHELQLQSWFNTWGYYLYGCTWTPLLTITGIWGYHSDYANAWPVLTTLAAAIIDTTGKSITVADVDAPDDYGITPAISVGNLIRIDSEMMLVTATNTATNVVTVTRGVNGSTTATHLINANVSVWQVEPDIARVVARQAGLLYARFGAYTTIETNGMGGVTKYPADLLQELDGVLQELAYD